MGMPYNLRKIINRDSSSEMLSATSISTSSDNTGQPRCTYTCTSSSSSSSCSSSQSSQCSPSPTNMPITTNDRQSIAVFGQHLSFDDYDDDENSEYFGSAYELHTNNNDDHESSNNFTLIDHDLSMGGNETLKHQYHHHTPTSVTSNWFSAVKTCQRARSSGGIRTRSRSRHDYSNECTVLFIFMTMFLLS